MSHVFNAHYSLHVFMAAAEEIGVAKEVVVETMRPAKKRTQLKKKGLESACKSMLLLAVDPGLNATHRYQCRSRHGPLQSISFKEELVGTNIVILAFIALLIGESLTCYKRIHQGDIITSFLFTA